MGYIKEPKGVDFIIQSEPWTEEEKKALSEFIRKDIERQKAEKVTKKRHRTAKKKRVV